jgi:spermidine synthase
MKPREILATVTTPDGSRFQLQRQDGNYVILANGYPLMTSYSHGSEDAMMSIACPRPRPDACILIGGLGMGYTLSATLNLMPTGGTVVVSEIVPEVVEWNRGPLAPLAGHPLNDPRTVLLVGDVADVIRNSKSRFDAILLDVDNSWNSFTLSHNSWLYTPEGLAATHRSLRTKGSLAIWSVSSLGTFQGRLRGAGFTPSIHPVRGHNKRGGHYYILLGRKNAVLANTRDHL